MTTKQISETFNRLQEINKQVKLLEEEERILKEKLSSSIPSGSSKAGIYHLERRGKVVSWSKVFNRVVESFVPKSKLPKVETIVQEETKETVAHIFKAKDVL
jgi:hypothetical protein